MEDEECTPDLTLTLDGNLFKSYLEAKDATAVQEEKNMAEKVSSLHSRITEMQIELTDAYKSKSSLQEEVISLRQDAYNEKNTAKNYADEVKALKDNLSEYASKLEKAENELKMREATISVARDELQALQMELVRGDELRKKIVMENERLILSVSSKTKEERVIQERRGSSSPKGHEKPREGFLSSLPRSLSMLSRGQQDISGSDEISNGASSPLKEAVGTEVQSDSKTKRFIAPPTKCIVSYRIHSSEVYAMTRSNAGDFVVTGSNDRTAKVWDTSSYSCQRTLLGCMQGVITLSIDDKDEHILGGSLDNSVRIWDRESGRVRTVLTGHMGKVYGSTFITKKLAATGAHDRAVKLWDLTSGWCVKSFFCFSSCNCVMSAVDSKMLFSGHFDHRIRVWDISSGKMIQEMNGIHSGQITSLCLSPSGNEFLSYSRDSTLKLFDVSTFKEIRTFKSHSNRNALSWTTATFSPDGSYIAAGGEGGKITIWRTSDSSITNIINNEKNSHVCSCQWLPSGALVCCDRDKHLTVWGEA